MTKYYICAMDFLDIMVFSRKVKETRTNLNVPQQFKNSSDSKKNQVLLRLMQNLFSKSLECFSLFQKQALNLRKFWGFVC